MDAGSPQPTQHRAAGFPAGPPPTGTRSRHLKRDRGRVMGQRERTHPHTHTHTHLGAQGNDPLNHAQRRWWPRPASIQARDSDMCPAINDALGPWGRTAGGGVGFRAQNLTMAQTWYQIRTPPRRADSSTPRTQKVRHRSGAHHAQTFSQAGPGLACWKLLAAFLRSKISEGPGARPGHTLVLQVGGPRRRAGDNHPQP